MNNKKKEKFGDLLLDTAKYLITAVVLSTFFQGIEEWEWYTYVIAMTVIVVVIWAGLSFFTEAENKESHNNKKRR